jgi:hypothetical protein
MPEYVNPQLQASTVNAILALKSWLANKSVETLTKEQYGEDICECCNGQLVLAAKYIEYMQCYRFSYYEESGIVNPYNCLTEDELKTLLEKSKLITTQKC